MSKPLPLIQVLIFGGTAAYWFQPEAHADVVERLQLKTRFGDAAPVWLIETGAGLVGFASRHGEGRLRHSARFINHRANIAAARTLGVRWILSWNGVGALRPEWGVGDLAVITDILDFTRGRVDSFGEPFVAEALWPRGSRPFAAEVLEALGTSLGTQGRPWHPSAVYACSEGPRLETAAEIRLFREAGADVVGMTLCPEVWLAAELGIGYGALGYITNHATGVRPQARSGREFGPIVAETCFPILLRAAELLLQREAAA